MAVVVAERWVLTGAVCAPAGTSAKDFKVRTGVTPITPFLSSVAWTDAERVVVHEGFDAKSHENDLALVKVSKSLAQRIIELPAAGLTIPAGELLEVTAWDVQRNVLLKGQVPYVDNASCEIAYDSKVKAGMLCAGFREGGVDACQGATGSPLVWRTGNGPVLIGIVSWGEGCGQPLKYGVYTRVSSYVDWINKVIADDASAPPDLSTRGGASKKAYDPGTLPDLSTRGVGSRR